MFGIELKLLICPPHNLLTTPTEHPNSMRFFVVLFCNTRQFWDRLHDGPWLLSSSWLVYHSHAAISNYIRSVAENCHYILLFKFFSELLLLWILLQGNVNAVTGTLYSFCFNFVIRIFCCSSEWTVCCFSLPKPAMLGSSKVIIFYHIVFSY